MISSLAVMLQFAVLDEISWGYASIFGFTSLLSAYTGLTTVKWYIKQSGRESIIALLLIIVLVFALLSLPIKLLLDMKDAPVIDTVSE